MLRWGILALRAALALVFIWFGLLKLTDQSPISPLIEDAFPWMPYPAFHYVLGAWELIIGLGLAAPLVPISTNAAGVITRVTLALLWLQLGGTFMPMVLEPGAIWDNYPPLLTLTGEFIVKNIVLATAGLAIGATVRNAGEPMVAPAGTLKESQAEGSQSVRR